MSGSRPILMVFPFDLLSHVLRCLQLADAVRDLYDVRFARSARYGSHIEQAGFDVFECTTFDAEEVLASARRFDFGWIREQTLRSVLRTQVAAIEDIGPALVLGDTAPTLRMAAEMTGVRHLSLMNGYMSPHYALPRPIASAHPAAVYADKLPPRVFEWMTRVGEQAAFRAIHKPFRAIRRDHGLAKLSSYPDELQGDVNVVCDDPAMFPQASVPDDTWIIGPLYHTSDVPEPEAEAFLQSAPGLRILATVGSSGNPDHLKFLNDMPDARVVVAGPRVPGEGRHTFQRPFINVGPLLHAVDVLICHGGNGSVCQAVSAGIPSVCLTRIFEQEWNARRVEELGLGAWLGSDGAGMDAADIVRDWGSRKGQGPLAWYADRIDVAVTRGRFRSMLQAI